MSKLDDEQEISLQYLGTITSDFVKVSDTLKEASYQMRVRNISKYPIFPVSKIEIPVGSLLLGKAEVGTEWNYYISMLEEFTQRKLVEGDGMQNFLGAYKDADEFCCLFVVDQEFTNFVFVPYPED